MKSFWMITSSWQNVENIHILFPRKETSVRKCYVKFVFWKVFKNSIKPLISPFLVMLLTFFSLKSTQIEICISNAFQGHSNGTLALELSKIFHGPGTEICKDTILLLRSYKKYSYKRFMTLVFFYILIKV